jgi:DtxR family Mn-dependent transcriptional regulator
VSEDSSPAITDSMQMYLVTIARLQEHSDPVPLSQIAEALSVSPVSVNEMCRKLQVQGLLQYKPYRGASLTEEGERRAHYILRRHRLWEVFLVEKLGLEYSGAHDAACQLEHSTPDLVANRLDDFLEHPAVNPEGLPIPRADGVLSGRILIALAALSAGQSGHVIRCQVDDAARSFLYERGIRPGAPLTVASVGKESLLVKVSGQHVTLARTLADSVQVEPEESNHGAE